MHHRSRRRPSAATLTAVLFAAAFALLIVPAAEAQTGATAEPQEVDIAVAAKLYKVCKGKFSSGGSEHVVTVFCPSIHNTCTCSNSGVSCGGNSEAPPSGSTYIRGTCDSEFVTVDDDSLATEMLIYELFFPEVIEEMRQLGEYPFGPTEN